MPWRVETSIVLLFRLSIIYPLVHTILFFCLSQFPIDLDIGLCEYMDANRLRMQSYSILLPLWFRLFQLPFHHPLNKLLLILSKAL